MARIRSIKPEFWTSLQVAERSPTVRLLFVGTWTFSDDRGVHPWSAKQIKMEVFPGDDFTISEVDDMLTELWRADLIRKFDTDDGTFFVVSGWHHQKIDRPNPKYPNPSDYLVRRWIDDHSPNDHRPIDDHSSLIGGIGGDRRGEERIGGEVGAEPPASPNGPAPDAPPPDPVVLEFPTNMHATKGETWKLRQSQVDQWAEWFPSVDVPQQCRNAVAWCHSNKRKRKTHDGMEKFLVGWLKDEQNKGGTRTSPNGSSVPSKEFDSWIAVFPRQTNHAEASEEYPRAVEAVSQQYPDRNPHEILYSSALSYAKSRAGKDPEYTTSPSKWLSGQRWNDEPLEDNRSSHQRLIDYREATQ